MSKLYNLELRDRDNEIAMLRKRVEILEMDRADARAASAESRNRTTPTAPVKPLPKPSLLPKLANYPIVERYADLVRTVLYEHKTASDRVKWFDNCITGITHHEGGVSNVIKGQLYRKFDQIMGTHQPEIGYYNSTILPKKGGRAFRILGIDELASVLVACVCDKVSENLDKAG